MTNMMPKVDKLRAQRILKAVQQNRFVLSLLTHIPLLINSSLGCVPLMIASMHQMYYALIHAYYDHPRRRRCHITQTAGKSARNKVQSAGQ